ncbi:MAG: hypothetical protein AB8H47_23675 [Bacteroidia bacterium]
MNLVCPSCSRKTTALEVENMDFGVVSCQDCSTEYHILGYSIDQDDRSYKQITQTPKGLRFKQLEKGTRFIIKNDKGKVLSLIWAILVLGITGLIVSAEPNPNNVGKFDFVAILTLAAIYLSVPLSIYFAFRNRCIEMHPSKIQIAYSFLGWIHFPIEYLITDFEQFYVHKRVLKSKGKRYVRYSLIGKTKDLQTKLLIENIRSFSIAFFLEQELEEYYGIVDESLLGEFDPRKELDKDWNLGDSFLFVKKVLKNTKEEEARTGIQYRQGEKPNATMPMLVKKMEQAKRYRSY